MTTTLNKIARTGRVQNWLDNPESRLPVSCTIFNVADEMEGPEGIEASWRFASHALRNGAGVAVHLSELRAKGSENGKGLVASGPCSFGLIYSTINKILRRGGHYKNGAIVLTLDLCHPDIEEFINMSRAELDWAKRCINLNQAMWDEASTEVRQAVIEGIKRGDIWLAKIRFDRNGERIFSNVCLEVFVKSRGTCLLEHVNVSACKIDEIPAAFTAGMAELCELHSKTGVGETGEYLDPLEDRQVGLGMLGLANLIAMENVTYAELADALEYIICEDNEGPYPTRKAVKIVKALHAGIQQAAEVARAANMDRAFAIAPTASTAYRYKDRAGYTTAPEIAPPIGRIVDRDSSTFGVTQYDHGFVETAEEVGWTDYFRVANGIMTMLQETGMCHGYSFNSWSDIVVYDEEFIQTWLNSPQTSLYYSLQVMQNTQAKDDIMNALDDDFRAFFELDEEDTAADDLAITEAGLTEYADPTACVGCAE